MINAVLMQAIGGTVGFAIVKRFGTHENLVTPKNSPSHSFSASSADMSVSSYSKTPHSLLISSPTPTPFLARTSVRC